MKSPGVRVARLEPPGQKAPRARYTWDTPGPQPRRTAAVLTGPARMPTHVQHRGQVPSPAGEFFQLHVPLPERGDLLLLLRQRHVQLQ